MDISTSPFAVLTLISAPAVLTNASCVLLFGTGNRYGRAIDRVHQGTLPTHHRTTCDSFLNSNIRSAIESTGRKTLLIAGVATELAVQLPALTAADLGYRVHVVIDACGGMSERTEEAALLRLLHAGVTPVSVITLAGELAGELTSPRAQQAVGILFAMAGS